MRELFLTSLPCMREKSPRHLRRLKPALILQPCGDTMTAENPHKRLRKLCLSERALSERALKKWSVNTWNVAYLFREFPKKEFSQKEIYHIIRTWHLNNPGSEYSRQGIRAVLGRFTKKGYLTRRRLAGRRSMPLYRATDRGFEVFDTAMDLRSIWNIESSLAMVDHGRVPWSISSDNEVTYKIEFTVKPWSEVVAWEHGWPENKRITKIYLDPWIVKQIRLVMDGPPKSAGGWLWYRGKQFKMAVAKVRAIQLFVGDHTWRDELKEWLDEVPSLEDRHLDQIWNRIAERAQHMTLTREFHVVDPKIAAAQPDFFREDKSQRRGSTDHPRICLLTSSKVLARSGGLRSIGRRRCRMHDLRSSDSIYGTLRTQVPQEGPGDSRPDSEGLRGQAEHGQGTERTADREVKARASEAAGCALGGVQGIHSIRSPEEIKEGGVC